VAEVSRSSKTLFDKLTLTPCTNGIFLASASVGAPTPGRLPLVNSTPPRSSMCHRTVTLPGYQAFGFPNPATSQLAPVPKGRGLFLGSWPLAVGELDATRHRNVSNGSSFSLDLRASSREAPIIGQDSAT
jgi:hypothetical protein